MSGFAIESERFRGPIELLLELVEARKMHISDVSLSEVADKFIAYIESLPELPVADTANFVYVASVLLLIKSKALLPGLELTEDEQSSIGELEQRLAIFKLLKEQMPVVAETYGRSPVYEAQETKDYTVVFAPTPGLTLSNIELAIKDVFARVPKEEKLQEGTVRKVVSLEEMIDRLHERITQSFKMSFKSFSNLGKSEKVEVVVSFLAMLELVKRGAISVQQHAHFTDIEMETLNTGVPAYN
ncbi:MAG TPA: segregation/condensation protein A [Candidatus Paceibacterota bacterium]